MKWFGSSGIRGVAFKEFSLELASKIAAATGTMNKKVVLGRDARTTGPVFSACISSALMSVGADVHEVGIVTTPTLAYAAKKRECGVMITASHNPPEYNGIKLWNPDGSSFDTRQMEGIERLMETDVKGANWSSVGSLTEDRNAIHDHRERILSLVGKSDLKVVLDCANGPASLITPFVLEEMGCQVITLNAQLDGGFPGRPGEPTEENLDTLKTAVIKQEADLGIAHDGDADRMVAIDDKGRYAGGDVLLKVFAKRLGARSMVAPVDASMLLDDWFGDKLYRTRVGDAYISEKVKECDADFGGEPSGTWVFPKISLCPDGIFAAARLVEICSDIRLSMMIDEMPTLPMLKQQMTFDASMRQRIIQNLNREIATANPSEIDTTDGYRLGFEDGWALIRLSGTEPKMRIVVEARYESKANDIMSQMKDIAKRCLT